MTNQQIIKASKGAAQISPDQRYVTEAYEPALVAPYVAGGISFEAHFTVKRDAGLTLVVLKAGRDKCEALKSTLVGKYGDPDAVERRQFGHLKWYDRKSNNIVVAYDTANSCDVVYRPIRLGSDKGL